MEHWLKMGYLNQQSYKSLNSQKFEKWEVLISLKRTFLFKNNKRFCNET